VLDGSWDNQRPPNVGLEESLLSTIAARETNVNRLKRWVLRRGRASDSRPLSAGHRENLALVDQFSEGFRFSRQRGLNLGKFPPQ
jgi:hypothetical protein